MRSGHRYAFVLLIVCMLSVPLFVQAKTTSWTGGGDSTNWFDAANWGNGLPAGGDTVTVLSGALVLTNATPTMNTFFITNASLSFSGADTALNADTVTVAKTASMTHYPYGTNDVIPNSNGVYITCIDFTLDAGASINVDDKGYTESYGPGSGWGNRNVGASHGGVGGGSIIQPKGVSNAPAYPGSGGGGVDYFAAAGQGGGVVRIQATGTVTIDGVITADGDAGNNAGGGAGGSVWISCNKLAGSGQIGVKGGNASSNGNGGGGGRIAVTYSPAAQAASADPTITFDAAGGSCKYIDGQFGTLYFTDSVFFPTPTVAGSGQVMIPGFTNWVATSFTLNDAWLRFRGLKGVTVSGELNVTGSNGRMDIINPEEADITCATFSLTNGGSLYVYGGRTNSSEQGYSTRVRATSKMTIASNSTLYLYSDGTNGGPILLDVRDLYVQNGGRIDADGGGYEYGYGQGKPGGTVQNAGSYGGGGGRWTGGVAGNTYGSSNAPISVGSPGGSGSAGGGFIYIVAARDAIIDGTLSADALNASSTDRGGGSGGAIWVQCNTIGGDGTMQARGFDGNRHGAGGGGGRIAIWYVNTIWAGTLAYPDAVQGGIDVDDGHDGDPGTIVWKRLPALGTVITIR